MRQPRPRLKALSFFLAGGGLLALGLSVDTALLNVAWAFFLVGGALLGDLP
jgi:hypothetical protein